MAPPSPCDCFVSGHCCDSRAWGAHAWAGGNGRASVSQRGDQACVPACLRARFFTPCGTVCARSLVAQRMARTTTLALQALVALLCLTVVSGQFFVNLNDKNKVGAQEK